MLPSTFVEQCERNTPWATLKEMFSGKMSLCEKQHLYSHSVCFRETLTLVFLIFISAPTVKKAAESTEPKLWICFLGCWSCLLMGLELSKCHLLHNRRGPCTFLQHSWGLNTCKVMRLNSITNYVKNACGDAF